MLKRNAVMKTVSALTVLFVAALTFAALKYYFDPDNALALIQLFNFCSAG